MKKNRFEKLNSIKDCRKMAGRPEVDMSVFPEDMREHMQGYYDTLVAVEAYRKIEGGEIDWSNSRQYKWTPWFWMSPAAFAFDYSYCDYAVAVAGSGSRLCLLSEEAASDLGTKFIDTLEKVQLK